MTNWLFTKRYRMRARSLGRECYIRCDGDVDRAYAMAKERLTKKPSEVGNPIIVLTIAALILQAIYYGIKIWREMNYSRPPIIPQPGEGFELGRGEAYALTESECRSLEDGNENQ